MLRRSLRRRLKKIATLIVLVYSMGYLVNLLHRREDQKRKLSIPDGGIIDTCDLSTGKKNIFFLETTGEECLTARQACSVESAARTNPQSSVTVHMELNTLTGERAWKYSGKPGQRRSCRITESLRQMDNVRLVREDLLDHLKDTPLWKIYEKGQFNQSQYPLTHRSDAVRVALLWKYGGAYLDLDCMVLRPLDCLHNTVGMVDYIPNWVENGVIIFEPKHPFIGFFLKYMVFAFKPEEYISLGPSTLTDAIKYFCDLSDFSPSVWYQCRKNSSLILQPPSSFYAIANNRQNTFYHPEADRFDIESLGISYLSHIYDAGNGRVVPADSLYDLLAQEYCPTVHAIAASEGEF